MRIPTVVASTLAAAALFGASLAPSTASVFRVPVNHGAAFQQGLIPHTMSRAEAQKFMHPTTAQKQAYKAGMAWLKANPHGNIRHPDKHMKTPDEWVTDDAGFIWAVKGKKVIGGYSDCSGAEGGVLDSSGNLVVACTNTATVNVYAPGASSASEVLYDLPGYYPAGAFEDSSGNIYATNLYGFSCTTYSCTFSDGNIVEWASGSGSGSPPSRTIIDPNMYEGYFGAVSSSGTIAFDGVNDTSYFPELDTSTDGGSTWSNSGVSINFPGGLAYTTGGDLGVNDQGDYGEGNGSFTIYSSLPSGVVFAGAYPQNVEDLCDAVGANFNGNDSEVEAGDAGCHAAATLTVPGGKGGDILNINFDVPIASIPTGSGSSS